MDSIIYSASPLVAYFGDFFWWNVFGTFLVMPAAITYGIFARNEKIIWRIGSLALGILILYAMYQQLRELRTEIAAGPNTVAAFLNDKHIAEIQGDIYYLLDTTAGDTEFIFFVPKRAFERVNMLTCYRFTYLKQNEMPDSILQAGKIEATHVTRIELMSESACR